MLFLSFVLWKDSGMKCRGLRVGVIVCFEAGEYINMYKKLF